MGQIGHLPQNRDEPYDQYLVETNHLDFINLEIMHHLGVDGGPFFDVFNLNVTSKNPLFMPP